MSASRHYSLLDQLVTNFDQALRSISGTTIPPQRSYPAKTIAESSLSPAETKHSASLIRVDHCGEICAQALYQGQALTARSAEVQHKMQQSAAEETDHLLWCQERLTELNSHTSYLNPLWYTGSLLIGILAGIAGDKWSLGFVAETERQVVKHLEDHLQQLPSNDNKSRTILEQMKQDEAHHATVAIESGAVELPDPIKHIMRVLSKIMTTIAYRI